MRNFNSISNFLEANTLQFIGGGNSQNEVRKTEGKQPRNRQRISNLSLTLVSTFVRYAACIALLLCLCVGQMWGAVDFTPAEIVYNSGAGTTTSGISVSSSYTSTTSKKLCTSKTSEASVAFGSSAGGNKDTYYLQVQVPTNCKITGLDIQVRSNGTTANTGALIYWTGAAADAIGGSETFSFTSNGGTDCTDAGVSAASIPANTRTVRIYRAPKIKNGSFDGSGTAIGSTTSFNIFGLSVTATGTVTHTLTNVTKSSGNTTATLGSAYNATFAAADGYTLPSTISVTIGGKDSTSACTWNNSTGALSIPARSVTGAIVVTITGEAAASGSGWGIAGTMNSWIAATDEMTGSGTVSATLSLSANTDYKFKIVDISPDTWYGNNGTIGCNISGWTFSTSEGDCHLLTSEAGDYTFEFNTSTKKLAVTYPGSYTFYYGNTSSWSKVYVYKYTEIGDYKAENASWPGVEISSPSYTCGGNGYYETTSDGYATLIFTNNNGSQTGDMAVSSSDEGKYVGGTGSSWTAWPTYTISFAAGSGSGSMSSISSIACGDDQAVTANSFTAPSGYQFSGWEANVDVKVGGATKTAGTLLDDKITIQEVGSNITLTAQWELIPTYDVVYDANSGSGTTASQTGNLDETQVTTRANGFTRSGYKFKWWNTAANGSGEDFYPGEKVTIDGADVTLYAQWEQVESGWEFWVGNPSAFTTNQAVVGDMTLTAYGNKTTINTDLTADPTIVSKYNSSVDKHAICIAVADNDQYVQVSFSDGSPINSLKLWATTNQTSSKNLAVIYSTTADFSTGEYEAKAVSVPANNAASKALTDFSPATENKYFYARIYRKVATAVYEFTGGSGNTARIYGVKAQKGVSCSTPDAPTGFSAGSITTGGATFSITDAANTNNYEIYYSTTSTAPTSSTEATTTTTSKSKAVTGLAFNTTYYAWVRAVCDEDHKSSWVALNPAGDTHTFTTSNVAPASAAVTPTNGWIYVPDEEIELTASATASTIDSRTTYTWYKGSDLDDAIEAGAIQAASTSGSTYTIDECVAADAGRYWCVISNGTGYESSASYDIKIYTFFLYNNSSVKIDDYTFTTIDRTNEKITVSVPLENINYTYYFKVSDGLGTWYGKNDYTITGSTNYCDGLSSSGANVGLTSSFADDYSIEYYYNSNNVVVTYPVHNQAASKLVYFDNHLTEMDNMYIRIGHDANSNASSAFTLVPGTANLYVGSTIAWSDFHAWSIADNTGWTGKNTIYQPWYADGKNKPDDGYAITKQTNYQRYVVSDTISIIPISKNKTEYGCDYYNVNKVDGMATDEVTISSYSNGTITVNYVDTSNTARSFTTGSKALAHTVVLTSITAVANTGYNAGDITINEEDYAANYVVTGATTVAATFTPKSCSVTFDKNGGKDGVGSDGTTATYDAAMTTITPPQRSGYTFEGYYDSETNNNGTGTKYYNADGTSAKVWDKDTESATTLYAQWAGITYNIRYYTEDGETEITGLSPTTYTCGVGVAELPTPEDSACHTFDGWYSEYCVYKDNEGEGFGWVSGCKKTSIGTITYGDYKFLGVWTLNSHTLTWNFNGGSTSDDYTAGGTVNCGTSLTYPTLSKTGYTFSSWSSDATEMPDEDLTITASWTANTYAVTLDPDNGNSISTVTAIYNADMPAKLSDGETDVAVPTFSGYTFGGYYDDHCGAGKQYYTNAVASANTWDKASTATLYAKWTQTVTLKTGSQGSGDDLTPTVLYKGTAISGFTTGHTAYGYKLLGYYTASSDGTKVLDADGTFAASNVTDYITDGKWTKTSATTLYAQWEDMMIELPGTLDKDNHIAKGGGLTIKGDTLDYGTGSNHQKDGYADWKVNVEKCVYIVTTDGYYPNGHQWKVYLISGSDTLSTCVFDNNNSTGSYTETKQWDLSGITSAGVYTIRMRNIREWGEPRLKSVTISPITVTYDANGGSCATESAVYGGLALTLPTPTRDGYVFEGWYNGETKIGDAGASYEPTASITLTAKWGVIVDLPGTINKTNVALYSSDMTWHGDDDEYFDYGPTSGANLGRWAKWEVNVVPGEYTISVEVDFPSPSPDGYQWGLILFDGADTVATYNSIQKWGYKTHTYSGKWDLTQDKAGNALEAGTYTLEVKNIFSNAQPKLKSLTLDVITVTYDANGGSCATESAVYGGSALTLPTPTWSGYTFEGWYSKGTKVGNAGASFTPTQDTTLYAHWTDNISGKLFSYIDGHYGDVRKSFDGTIISGNATEKDKTFTDGSTGVQFVIDDGAWDNKTNNIALLAKLVKGTTGMSVVIPTGKIAAVKIGYGAYYNTKGEKNYGPLTIGGSNQTGISTPLDDGKTNAQVDGALKEIELTSQTGTLTLGSASGNIFIGRVSAVITGYVITYATGDYGSGDSFTATKTAGSSYTISSTDNAFTRTNCVYDGWSVNADGSTKDYNFGASYTTDAPLTLYPHWVATCATPAAPTGFSAGSITDEGVTFTITDAGDAGNYDIYYNTSSTAPTGSTDATTTATAKTAEVTGLSEGTTYYAWVRAVCDEDHKSSWVALNPGGDAHTFFTHYTITIGDVTTRQHSGSTVGGEISAASHAAAGDEVTLTATPTSGYAFVSWTIEKTSDNSDVTSTVLSGDNTLMMPAYGVTVKATFAEQFTIVYKDEDKTTTLDGLEPTSYLYGTGVAALPTPTKTGYTFDSWYNAWCVDSKNKGSWEDECRKSSIGTTDYSNATYYASWTAIDYTITHSDAENGTYTIQVGDADATDATTTANIGQTITLSATPSSGYALSAWNVTSGGDPIDVVDGEFTMPAADVTIAPTFGVVYTVTFNTNGGSSVGAIEQNAPGAAIAMPDAPTKSGYDFVNWMIGGTTKAAGASYTPTANVTAYATWKAECDGGSTNGSATLTANTTSGQVGYTGGKDSCNWKINNVRFILKNTGGASSSRKIYSNGGASMNEPTFQMSSDASSAPNNYYIDIRVGSDTIIDSLCVRCAANGTTAGRAVAFCFGGESQVNVNNSVIDTITFPIISNGGTSSTAPNIKMTMPSNTRSVRIYKKARYDAENKKIVNATSTQIPSSAQSFNVASIIVYYHTTATLCYYVTYDGNGATSGYVNDPVAHAAGDDVTVASNYSGFTRTGYEFNGWNTEADGSGTHYDYYDVDHYKIEGISANITLYAEWKMIISGDNIDFDGYDDPTAYKDVVVTNGATLTITENTTVRDITVETGSTLNVNTTNGDGTGDGITLTANSLSLVGGWGRIRGETKYDMPRVYIAPASTLTKTVSTVNLDVAMDNRNYYPIAVPFPVDVKDIDYVNSTLKYYSVYGLSGQYAIKKYNGQSRANRGSNHANWEVMDDGVIYGSTTETLQPGLGYIMTALPAPGFGEYAVMRFPMEVDNAWTAGGEKGSATISAETVTKNVVAVEAYVKEEGETPKANKGWNLLGIPFMSCYQTSEDMYSGEGAATIIQGRFDYTTNKFDDEDEIRYVSVPTHDFSEYLQYNIEDEATKLMPGWCFFVQVETSGNLTYLSAQEAADSDLPIYAPKREKKALPTEKTGIFLSGANASDKTTILVSDKYSAAEYEINADLEKLFGEDSYTLATYSLSGETRLAYNAMSNADITNVIPIGYRAPEEGEYTFSINPRYAESAFERVDLIDYETGFVTNLLMSSYTFTSERTQSDARFAINVVKRKEVPTDIENGADGADDAEKVRKMIIDNKMYIILNGRMYDATGKMVK